MGCNYRVETEVLDQVDVLQDDDAGVRLRVRRTGAEMVSLARKDASGHWVGFLHRDNQLEPPLEGWGNHATVMGYFLHRLVDGKSTYDGEPISGGNHGFLRGFHFSAPTFCADARLLTYSVKASEIPAGAYPRPVAFQLTYALTKDGVRITFTYKNEDAARPAHVSFGLHPGFAVSSVAAAEVDLPAGVYRRYFAPDNFLNGEVEDMDLPGGPMPFDKSKLEGSYLVGIEGVKPNPIVLRDGARTVSLDFSEAPFMTIWSSGDDFICIEPCWGLPDSRPQKPFEQKIGIQVIPPGGEISAGFGIAVQVAG